MPCTAVGICFGGRCTRSWWMHPRPCVLITSPDAPACNQKGLQPPRKPSSIPRKLPIPQFTARVCAGAACCNVSPFREMSINSILIYPYHSPCCFINWGVINTTLSRCSCSAWVNHKFPTRTIWHFQIEQMCGLLLVKSLILFNTSSRKHRLTLEVVVETSIGTAMVDWNQIQ